MAARRTAWIGTGVVSANSSSALLVIGPRAARHCGGACPMTITFGPVIATVRNDGGGRPAPTSTEPIGSTENWTIVSFQEEERTGHE
jgi:hypothetical protein